MNQNCPLLSIHNKTNQPSQKNSSSNGKILNHLITISNPRTAINPQFKIQNQPESIFSPRGYIIKTYIGSM